MASSILIKKTRHMIVRIIDAHGTDSRTSDSDRGRLCQEILFLCIPDLGQEGNFPMDRRLGYLVLQAKLRAGQNFRRNGAG